MFSLRVLDLEASLENKRVHVVKFSRQHPWDEPQLEMYVVKNRRMEFLKSAWTAFYFRALTNELEGVRDELSTSDFTARYPWHRTADS